MKFRTRIWVLLFIAGSLFAVGLAVNVVLATRTSASLDRLFEADYPYRERLDEVERLNGRFKEALELATVEADVDKVAAADAVSARCKQALSAMAALPGRADDAGALAEALGRYQGLAAATTRAMLTTGNVAGQVANTEQAQTAWTELLAAQMQAVDARISTDKAEVGRGVSNGTLSVLITGLVVLTVLALASRRLVASLWQDMGDEPADLRQRMQRLAAGDLVQTQRQDEAVVGNSVSAAVETTIAQLRETIGRIQEASRSVAAVTSEIASSSDNLSERTDEASSMLQQSASFLEQLTTTVKESGEATARATELATAAVGTARHGGEIVMQVAASMGDIHDASRRIAEIVGVIDGIAFQTNLLALNAAVEAARAGEQGRGFAVVAGEVRMLAQRCADAAREIKGLISTSRSMVERGAQLAANARDAMTAIEAGVCDVNETIDRVVKVSQQQSAGIGHVTVALTFLDQMTTHSNTLVDESSAVANTLRQQADELAGAVARFRLHPQEVAA